MANVAAFLQLAQIILGLFPMIFEVVKAVEAAIPGAGNGKAKFDAVMGTIQGVYSTLSETTLPTFEKVAPAIGTAINSVVGVLNTTGVFKNSTPPAA